MEVLKTLLLTSTAEGQIEVQKYDFEHEDYTSYDTIVGGSFEAVTLFEVMPNGETLEYVLILDGEGKFKEGYFPTILFLQDDRVVDAVMGTVLIVKGQEEHLVGFTEQELDFLLNKFRNRAVVSNARGTYSFPYVDFPSN